MTGFAEIYNVLTGAFRQALPAGAHCLPGPTDCMKLTFRREPVVRRLFVGKTAALTLFSERRIGAHEMAWSKHTFYGFYESGMMP